MKKKRSVGIDVFIALFLVFSFTALKGLILDIGNNKRVTMSNIFASFENSQNIRYSKSLEDAKKRGIGEEDYNILKHKIELSEKTIKSYSLQADSVLKQNHILYSLITPMFLVTAIGFLVSIVGCIRLSPWARKCIFITSTIAFLFYLNLLNSTLAVSKLFILCLVEVGKIWKINPPLIAFIYDKVFIVSYIILVSLYLVIIFYFTRPKVKEQFK